MLRLIYYLMLAYCVYVVYKFITNLGRKRVSSKPAPRLSGMMVKDATCDTYVPKEEALREIVDGKEYFFCSQDCRRKFLEQLKK